VGDIGGISSCVNKKNASQIANMGGKGHLKTAMADTSKKKRETERRRVEGALPQYYWGNGNDAGE